MELHAVLALWDECVRCLQDELPSQQFNTWIRPLRASESEQGLVVSAPNRFVKDWVKDKFSNRIQSLLEELNGGQVLSFELSIGTASSAPSFMAGSSAPAKKAQAQQQPAIKEPVATVEVQPSLIEELG